MKKISIVFVILLSVYLYSCTGSAKSTDEKTTENKTADSNATTKNANLTKDQVVDNLCLQVDELIKTDKLGMQEFSVKCDTYKSDSWITKHYDETGNIRKIKISTTEDGAEYITEYYADNDKLICINIHNYYSLDKIKGSHTVTYYENDKIFKFKNASAEGSKADIEAILKSTEFKDLPFTDNDSKDKLEVFTIFSKATVPNDFKGKLCEMVGD